MADSEQARPQEDEEVRTEGEGPERQQTESPRQSPASEEQPPQNDEDASTEHVPTPATAQPVASDNASSTSHARSMSTATAASRGSTVPTLTPLPTSAMILSALETIAASKEAKRNQELGTAASTAISHIKASPEARFDPEVLFHPLELATKTASVSLQITALDCLGTLITFSYFAFPSASAASKSREVSRSHENNASDQAGEAQPDNQQRHTQPPPLIERAINTICDCFEVQKENTPNEVQQQIIKSLLAAVLNDTIVVHGRGLLAAVRQIYNIFIYSKSGAFQQVAQGSLIHIVSTVFDRLRTRLELRELRLQNFAQERVKEEEAQEEADESKVLSRSSSSMGIPTVIASEDGKAGISAPTTATATAERASFEQRDVATELLRPKGERVVTGGSPEKLTLQSFENNKEETMESDYTPTMVTRVRPSRPSKPYSAASGSFNANLQEYDDKSTEEEIDEIYAKDAFLVFRAMCKLSQRHKHLTHEQQQDVKSQTMRTKLVFLHIIHHLLNNYTTIFTSPLALVKSSNSSSSPSLTFCQAVKGDLCLSLSRNSASAVPLVYEVCCEIFWLLVKNMRMMMKKELEVFWKEVYLAILDKRNSPLFQKLGFLDLLHRLAGEPRALVEVYLNYDCDRNAWENIFQGIIEHLSRLSAMNVSVTPAQEVEYREYAKTVPQPPNAPEKSWTRKDSLPPSLATTRLAQWQPSPTAPADIPPDYVLKQRGLECLVEMVRSLESWCSPQSERDPKRSISFASHPDLSRDSIDAASSSITSTRVDSFSAPNGTTGSISSVPTTTIAEDDPQEMEKVKQRKNALSEAIRQFNFKPKTGLKLLLSQGFIHSRSPEDIASFLLSNDRFDKAALGEFLGEGDTENVAIMHAFVDFMNFHQQSFVTALRNFLQTFRLPGEAQKIDRFMLKFAERYQANNQSAFATADTPYVLAYSVIMLNTDLHSGKLKRPMTKEDFIKNNRGINDSKDLPSEYLGAIYDDIQNNEIVLDTERETAAKLGLLIQPPLGLASRAGQVLTTIGRDIEGEKYMQASEEITTKTEKLYRRLIREQRKSSHTSQHARYIPATSVQHVAHMFNVTWMSFLSGLSAPVQETSNAGTIRLAMEGMRIAIRISCIFDLDTPREAFIMALSNFTNLSNPREMTSKNLEALKVLLEIAITEGNMLKTSWREILFCISQLDRLQLLTERMDDGPIGDRSSSRYSRDNTRKAATAKRLNTMLSLNPDVIVESRSTDMIRMVDAIYTNTANLSSEAIVDFVRALTQVSWQEIQSSANSESPRMYCLQKLVEVSYYNMTRVRIEWSRMWEVLGSHFNQVGCHTNTHVVFFALDSLRQLSMRFMEIAELPGFKFQKDFLKSFEHVMANSNAASVKDMVLRCLSQMIQTRGSNIRSGWKSMFGVFIVAAKEPYEGIVSMAMEHVSLIYDTRFPLIITQGAFMDMIICLTEFSKNLRFQKKSLQAIEMLKMTAPKLLNTPECPLYSGSEGNIESAAVSSMANGGQSPEEQFWYPLLIAFQDVLMTGDDLEVRSRALTYLFQILIRHGGDFPREFWDVLWRQLLYPIFVVLQSKSEMMKVSNHEELSVWLSTTMIQALRNMITLFTHYLESLKYMLNRFLGLLTLCICQENDTIARIGSNCLQQLILQNVTRFNENDWHQIVNAFVDLFERTTAHELFTAAQPREQRKDSVATSHSRSGSISGESTSEQQQQNRDDKINDMQDAGDMKDASRVEEASGDAGRLRSGSASSASSTAQLTASRRRFFNKIITNCVLQLLMIETVHELFSNDVVLEMIPEDELLTLTDSLKKSYLFAKRFHEAKELRLQLWRLGFMKQPPNLLKQESGSAATYVNILFRMYNDNKEDRVKHRDKTEEALLPLCTDIIRNYVHLDEETQQRNIAAWRPVVVDVMEGVISFPTEVFGKYIETLYPILIELLNRDVSMDIRLALQAFLRRVGELRLGMPASSQSSYLYGNWTGAGGGRRKTSPSFSR